MGLLSILERLRIHDILYLKKQSLWRDTTLGFIEGLDIVIG